MLIRTVQVAYLIDATAMDIGTNLNFGNLALLAYYYSGEGSWYISVLGYKVRCNGDERDSDGGYVQATYVIPTGTKLGVAYGVKR